MIKIAIVEDSQEERDKLNDLILQFQKDNDVEFEIHSFENGFQFLTEYKCDFDIILMDIDMPQLNGYQTAMKIREKDESVILIFITNIASYVYKGYQVGAMDYILKPVYYQDLAMRLKACVKKLSKNNGYCFVINTKNGMNKIPVSDILYMESIGHDITIHRMNDNITFRGPSMKALEAELVPQGFFRCNHGYIVNLKYCEKIDGTMLSIKGNTLEISRSKKKAFVDALMRYHL